MFFQHFCFNIIINMCLSYLLSWIWSRFICTIIICISVFLADLWFSQDNSMKGRSWIVSYNSFFSVYHGSCSGLINFRDKLLPNCTVKHICNGSKKCTYILMCHLYRSYLKMSQPIQFTEQVRVWHYKKQKTRQVGFLCQQT